MVLHELLHSLTYFRRHRVYDVGALPWLCDSRIYRDIPATPCRYRRCSREVFTGGHFVGVRSQEIAFPSARRRANQRTQHFRPLPVACTFLSLHRPHWSETCCCNLIDKKKSVDMLRQWGEGEGNKAPYRKTEAKRFVNTPHSVQMGRFSSCYKDTEDDAGTRVTQ